jgi:hypothetical protein
MTNTKEKEEEDGGSCNSASSSDHHETITPSLTAAACSSRAIIVHPQFKEHRRHPIYNLLITKQLEAWRSVSVPGFSIPFVVHQNFVSSQQDDPEWALVLLASR